MTRTLDEIVEEAAQRCFVSVYPKTYQRIIRAAIAEARRVDADALSMSACWAPEFSAASDKFDDVDIESWRDGYASCIRQIRARAAEIGSKRKGE